MTYRARRGGGYRRLIRGFVKCSLGVFLALLKSIVKIPEIISLPALFEVIEIIAELATIIHFAGTLGIFS